MSSNRKRVGLFLGPITGLVLYLLPFESLLPQAHTLAAVLAFVCMWWITEPIPIPVTALLGAVLCVMLNVADARKVFTPFADPIIFLSWQLHILANAMALHGLDKRFAYKILSVKWIGNHSGRLLFAFGAITAFLSMWISNTATTAMMFPIALGIISAHNSSLPDANGSSLKQTRFATGLMLLTAYAASVGGVGTPVGTPPNLIGIGMLERLAHIKIPFFQWMALAIPILIIMYFFLFALMYMLHKPEVRIIKMKDENSLLQKLLPLESSTRGEINCLIAFFTAVILWILPGFIAILYSTESELYKSYNRIFPKSESPLLLQFFYFFCRLTGVNTNIP